MEEKVVFNLADFVHVLFTFQKEYLLVFAWEKADLQDIIKMCKNYPPSERR